MQGNIVYSVAVMSTGDSIDERTKVLLDYAHMKKIELSDTVFVLNVGGFVGESTRREIALATTLGKEVRYLSREYPEWTEEDCIWI